MFDLTRTLDCAGRILALDKPRIAGIVNVTPDSFSDGGKFLDAQRAIEHGLRLVEEGADLLDIGGESTRPGAESISAADEIARVVPVIEALAKQASIPIAIDTSKAEVMRAAVAAGAGLINDVRALRENGALDAAAELKVPVCLMHMQGEPRTMQSEPHYLEVVEEVKRFLTDRIFACELSGIDKKRIMVDPGFGFGKTLEHNLALLRGLDQIVAIGVPVLAGLSRKAMIGALTGREVGDRAAGSVAAALIAVQKGAAIVRVHDVAITRDALAVWHGVASGAPAPRRKPAAQGSARFGDDD
ncbi:MAG: dihydropteroate synthase [Gammaproteobacteria bacterium]|nr:MAG: dihydropteroate synthase [Gammaproteobacteria bacterium]